MRESISVIKCENIILVKVFGRILEEKAEHTFGGAEKRYCFND